MVPNQILVATEFSTSASAALDLAAELAVKLGARLHLLNVVEVAAFVPELAMAGNLFDDLVKANQVELDKLANARRGLVDLGEVLVRVGDPREVIVKTCEQLDIELLVLGTHGRRGVKRALLGSVAETIVRTAPCPVMTVRVKS
jgi:universal stress protein A